MKRTFIIVCTFLLCFLLIQLLSQDKNQFQNCQQLYAKAESLFNGEASDSTDSIALNYYNKIVQQLQPSVSNAQILYNCFERIGILKQGLGYTSKQVLQEYHAALFLQQQYHLSDSVLFRLLLSAGNVHYNDGLFDSSVYYFSEAEKIINKYPSAGLAGDLYNSLGALYSEAGDYVQSGVYFNKALELTKKTRPDLGDALFAMSANIASSVRLSGYPDSALHLYKKLLDVSRQSLPIINNIAGIYLSKKNPDSALYFLQLAKTITGNYGIAIYNALAQAYMLKNDTAKAAKQLANSTRLYKLNAHQLKNNYYAATCKYYGDLSMMEQHLQSALVYYQQAIIEYDYSFNDSDVFSNPGNFIGDFTSYNLFDALAAKANCLALIYNQQKNVSFFNAVKNTYESAFALSDYIKKSIDNDEARLFIADKVFDTYIKAVDFLLNAQHDNNAIELALQWISKSRATSLAISLKENTIKRYAGLPDSLLQKERNIKITISRLKLQLQQATDSTEQSKLVSDINSAALQLQSLNNIFKTYPDYYRQKFSADSVNISAIQKNVLTNTTAAICYFKGTGYIHAFVVTQKNITIHEIKIDSKIEKNITDYIQRLSANSAGQFYTDNAAKYLYSIFINPLLNDLAGISSLIIIPDKELINIPFEAFQPDDNKFLIQDYDITYQYALAFLQKNTTRFTNKNAVAFAPFAHQNKNSTFAVLPASTKEISDFKKQFQYIDNNAGKSKFMAVAAGATVIHLATHAEANYIAPSDSYIAFYRFNNTDSNYKIFAHEIYNLQLPRTQLVFLSACETGSGKISQSEGALSLSRAFAFAGCPNIVTSLWKAEDVSTAYISKKFYEYAVKKFTYAQALQKAKTDLLSDPAMSQYHAPQYWSHLIFIGDVQNKHSSYLIWIAIAAVILVVLIIILHKRRLKA